MTVQQFDFSVNLLRALLWQYNEAARLESLLSQKQDWYNQAQTEFWESWIRDVFDLRTANAFGLSVWARILDMPLTISTGSSGEDNLIWGFADDDENFDNGNFEPWIKLPLSVEQSRLILRLRYFQLVTRATVPEINDFMAYLFADLGSVYVVDGLNMTARYVFGFELSNELQVVLSSFDLLPRPAGVRVDYIVIPEVQSWGFGRYHENYDNGNFNHG